ncbi:unnamed protein product [Adineta steineri]|uniref:NAD(P)(+)--arginine ADP-ribosyltransferase n=1 Tax=Adineta steineri TaxID=433720 RepID=A0A818GU45_9BILA|nr:unnamed protein product [Adineta steineri]CAF3497346.1 unnamed protein product [Adineta steineri]
MPGSLIMWPKFNSSKKGKEVARGGGFNERNTHFKIYSLTGRPIGKFSHFPDEDEILFLPYSTFIVFRHETTHHGALHTIYMRQLELGLGDQKKTDEIVQSELNSNERKFVKVTVDSRDLTSSSGDTYSF